MKNIEALIKFAEILTIRPDCSEIIITIEMTKNFRKVTLETNPPLDKLKLKNIEFTEVI